MKIKLNWFIILILFFTTFPVYSFNIKKDAPIPSVCLPNLSNQLIDIQQTSLGKPYLMTFLSINNKSSLNTISYYKDLLGKLGSKLDIYIIILDRNEISNANLAQYKLLETKNLFLLVDATQQVAKEMQVLILPMTFFINKNHLLNNIYIDMDSRSKSSILKDISHELSVSF